MTSVRLMMALLPSPGFHLPAVIALATCTWGIISLWAATSKWPWYVRACVICLLLSCLVAISAYEPILYFLLQSTVVVLGVAIWSNRQRDTRSSALSEIKFSLRSLLFITVFGALFFSVLARMERHPPVVWASLFWTGLASGMVTLLAAWLSTPSSTWSKRFGRVLLALLLTALCALPGVATDGLLSNFPGWQRAPGAAYDPTWSFLLLGILFGIYLWLLLWSWVVSLQASQDRYRWAGGLALLAWSMILAAPCIDIYFSLPPMPRAPKSRRIEENGFTEIEKAATELYVANAALNNSAEATSAQIRLGLDRNTETLATIRRGLSQECMRQPYGNYDWSSVLATAQKMRPLARMLMAEGELAQREGRIDDAIASYVDILRLSRATEKGALAVDALVARAIENMAFLGISGLRDRLTPQRRRMIAKALSDSDHQREDYQTILDRDVAWARVVWGWRALLAETLDQGAVMNDAMIESQRRMETLTRLFLVEFAIEDYQHEHGRLPVRLEELALDTDFVRDPFSPDGAPLQYRVEGESFLVFSLGPDRDDDAGRPPKDIAWIGDGDYRLDALYADEE